MLRYCAVVFFKECNFSYFKQIKQLERQNQKNQFDFVTF
jgi:hypothetical protein